MACHEFNFSKKIQGAYKEAVNTVLNARISGDIQITYCSRTEVWHRLNECLMKTWEQLMNEWGFMESGRFWNVDLGWRLMISNSHRWWQLHGPVDTWTLGNAQYLDDAASSRSGILVLGWPPTKRTPRTISHRHCLSPWTQGRTYLFEILSTFLLIFLFLVQVELTFEAAPLDIPFRNGHQVTSLDIHCGIHCAASYTVSCKEWLDLSLTDHVDLINLDKSMKGTECKVYCMGNSRSQETKTATAMCHCM